MLGIRKHRIKRVKKEEIKSVDDSWKLLYKKPPDGNLTIEDFEVWSYDRYTLLRNIEVWRQRGMKKPDLMKNIFDDYKKKFGDTPKKDSVSHHILRIAYCKTENLRTWFVNQEKVLFESRLNKLDQESLHKIALQNNLHDIVKIDQSEVASMQSIFRSIYKGVEWSMNTPMFKVHFNRVPSLVRTRRVYIEKGVCYVTGKQLITYLNSVFERELKGSMYIINQNYSDFLLLEKDRLAPFLDQITNKKYDSKSNKKYNTSNKKVTVDMIDGLAKESFPPCMRLMYQNIMGSSHLKHMARLQFGLFLKGIGVNCENALIFFRNQFTKKMTDMDFNKGYVYGIKYNYGLCGKRTSFSPYACRTIITGGGESGGCPFKKLNQDRLRQFLKQKEITDDNINVICTHARLKQYQVGCRKYFELTHKPRHEWTQGAKKNDKGIPFYHPNQYYKFSRQIIENLEDDDDDDEMNEEEFDFSGGDVKKEELPSDKSGEKDAMDTTEDIEDLGNLGFDLDDIDN